MMRDLTSICDEINQMRIRTGAILILMLCVTPAVSASPQDNHFESQIRPLLANRCYKCHRRKAEGGLRLDSRQAMLKGGMSCLTSNRSICVLTRIIHKIE
jgi:hypothetical protein